MGKDSAGNIVITDVLEDGAAFNDGFLKVQYINLYAIILYMHVICGCFFEPELLHFMLY